MQKNMFKKEGKYIPFPGTRDDDSKESLILTPDESPAVVRDPLKEAEDKVIEYNTEISTNFTEFENINLIGPKVLFRPFKVSPKTKGGLARSFALKYQDPETGRVKTVNADFSLQYRGVICKVSDECPEEFKNKVKIGSIVDIQTIAWQQHQYLLNRDVFNETEEPFTFWLTPNHIQAVIENYEVK